MTLEVSKTATITQRFTDLKIWRRSHELVLRLDELTSGFRSQEHRDLVRQLRRAAVSVPTNIAEGAKRRRNPDYARFLIAEASLAETQYLLLLSRDLGYVQKDEADVLIGKVEEIARMTYCFRIKVERHNQPHRQL